MAEVFLIEIVSPHCTTNTSGLPLKSALTKNTSAKSPKITNVFSPSIKTDHFQVMLLFLKHKD